MGRILVQVVAEGWKDVWTLARPHRSEADNQGASREASEVVLKENPRSIVENQQFRKKQEKIVALASSLEIIQRKFFSAVVKLLAGQQSP